MVRFRTLESSSPGKSPGRNRDCTAHRAGNAAYGTRRERPYSSDPNRRHRSMDAAVIDRFGQLAFFEKELS